MAALFDMQMAGGDCIWKLGNGMKRCDSQSWFASLMEWLMRRLFTHAANLLHFFLFHCVCARLHFCMRSRAPALHRVYVRIPYVYRCAHTCVLFVCLSVRLHTSAPGLSQGFSPSSFGSAAPWLLICSPPCLPRSPISPSISLRVSRS